MSEDKSKETEGLEDEREGETRELLAAIQEVGSSGARIQCSVKRPSSARFDYAGTIPASEFSLERLAEQFGGGEFKLRLFGASGKVAKVVVVSVDPMIKPISARSPEPGALTESRLVELLSTLRAPAPPPDNSLIIAQMQQQGQIMTALIGALAQRQPDTSDRFLQAIQPLILKSLERPSNGIDQVIELATALGEISGKSDDGESSMPSKLLGAIGPLLARFAQPQPQPQAHVQPQPQLQAPAPPATPAAPSVPSGLVEQWSGFLFRWADSKTDPAEVADRIESLLSDNELDMIIAACKSPDWLHQLFGGQLPEAEARLEWMAALKSQLLTPPDDDDDNEAPPPPPAPAPQTKRSRTL